MRSRIKRGSGVTLVALALTASAAGAVMLAPGPMRPVSYVPSIVAVPSNPRWGRPISYRIEIRSHIAAPTTVGLELLLYLSAPVGQSTTQLGVYHRTVHVPTSGTGSLTFTATAPKHPSGHQVCLGITVVGDSSGAYICTPVT
ncbi:MAG: hypothetical protein ACXVRJ_12750 [Gaiellaceae bacterium]